MASRDDEGQVILLAGVLLVIAFILFSIQINVLVNLGQEAGREVENPVVDDYRLLRRAFQSVFEDELRSASGTVDCPNLYAYAQRVRALVDHASALESVRGFFLSVNPLEMTSPSSTTIDVTMGVTFSDGTSTIIETVTYRITCSGAVGNDCPPPPIGCLV